MAITVKYGDQDITFEPITDLESVCSEVDLADSGGYATASQGLTENTIKGIKATMGLIINGLGHKSAKVTSLVRQPTPENPNSQHIYGTAVDIVDKSDDDGWYGDFLSKVVLYSDNFNYSTQNGGLCAWHTGVDHEGSGYHMHLDNYLGGLAGETDAEKKQMQADCNRDSNGTPISTAIAKGKSLVSSRTNNIKVSGSTVELLPSQKTYAEPVYPDYIAVTGNIPNSTVTDTVVNSADKTENVAGYNVATGETMQQITGLDMNAFTTNAAQAQAQAIYDPTSDQQRIKTPTGGKPLNNNDPYPVDLKIEELEMHMPRVKKYTMPFDKSVPATKEIAINLLKVSDFTEKRLVKLENILATVLRYTFGMGKRMYINCQYYGGQDENSKYQTIRCLKDDCLNDGQVMQIDQCLSCSRYEAVIGKVYEVLNEVGANAAVIQDDCQAGFMNMDEYIAFVRVDKMLKMRKDMQLEYKDTETRNENERSFADQWDDGVKMTWKMVPVELQKPQINWRQDINSQDKSPEKLGTYQPINGAGGSGMDPGITLKPGNFKDIVGLHLNWLNEVVAGKHDEDWEESVTSSDSSSTTDKDKTDSDKDKTDSSSTDKDKTDSSSSSTEKKTIPEAIKTMIKEALSEGQSQAEKACDNLKSIGYEQSLQNACSKQEIDPIMVMAYIALRSAGTTTAADGLFGIGDGETDTQIEKGVAKIKEAVNKASCPGNPLSMTGMFDWNDELNKLNVQDRRYDGKWYEAINKLEKIKNAFFPQLMAAYKKIDESNTGLSQLTDQNNNEPEFPVASADLDKIYFVQDYGLTNVDTGVAVASNAIGFKCSTPVPIITPAKCSTQKPKTDKHIGSYVTVTSGDTTIIIGGLTSVTDDFKDEKAEEIDRGKQIGTCDGTLYIQTKVSGSFVDPKTVWRLLNQITADKDTSVGKQVAKANTPKGSSSQNAAQVPANTNS